MTSAATKSSRRIPTIGFDIPPGSGGPSRYVAALVRGLDPDEWEVVYPLGSQPCHRAPDATAAAAQPANAAADDGRLVHRIGRQAVSWLPRSVRYVAGFARQSLALSRQISPARLDIFHVQNTGCEEAPLGGRLAGAGRVVGTFHVNSTADLNLQRSGLIHRSLEAISNRCLHKAIAVSEATKRDWIRRTGIRDEQVAVIHNGIDLNLFSRRQSRELARIQLQLPRDAVIVGGMGRLESAKGFVDLIEAAARWRSEFPFVRVAIAGEGALRPQLEASAASLGIGDHVTLLGFCNDVNLFLDACDVFALPSLSEALPFALLEAMAHELPAVGTIVGGVPEVIVPGETGFLAPARSPEALAAAMRPLLASAELRQRMGSAGRQRVGLCFRESDMVRRTLRVYRALLPKHLQH